MTRSPFWIALTVAACGAPATRTLAHREPERAPVAARRARLDVAALRAALAAWEPKWDGARACLVGSPQRAADLGDAIAMGSLLAPPVDRFDSRDPCTFALEQVASPPGLDDAPPGVQDALVAIDLALEAGRRVERESGRDNPAALAAAIHDVDDWLTALHQAAGTPAATHPAHAVPQLAMLPQADALHAPAPQLDDDSYGGDEPRVVAEVRHGVVRISRGRDMLVLSAPDRADTVTVPREGDGASPAGGWSVIRRDHQMIATPSDPAQAPVVLYAGSGSVAGALGDGDHRAVVLLTYARPEELIVMRSVDAGRHWSVAKRMPAIDVREIVHHDDDSIDLDVGGKTSSWLHVTAAEVAKPVEVRGLYSMSACVGAHTLWLRGENGVRWTDGTHGGEIRREELGTPIACSADAVVLRDSKGLARCTRTACDAPLAVPDTRDGVESQLVALLPDGLAITRQSGSIVAVMRTGAAMRFAHLPAGHDLLALVSWQERLYLITSAVDGVHVAPAP
jgi:hypothetical protein